jgi:thiamine-phosphate pyrophosphorylase
VTLAPLYAILDDQAAALAGWDPIDLARAWFDAGVRLIQVRAKLASSARLLELCTRVGALAHDVGGLVVVNDRFDVALAAGALAVHVGQDDVPVSAVRRWLGPDGVIGLSTHTREQIDAALYEPITYLAVGPVFGTASKDTGYDAVGLALVEYAASKTTLPIVAIGGITEARARSVIDAGAASVAVIGDLLHGDPGARVRAFLQALR